MREAGEEKHVVITNADGKNLQFLTKGEQWHLYPDISPNGENVLYMQSNKAYGAEIISQNLTTKNKRKWNQKDGLNFHPRFSRNGRYLAFSQPQGNKHQIAIVDLLEAEKQQANWQQADDSSLLEYRGETKVIEDAHPCYFPHLSSDGSFLVYQRSITKENREIVFLDLQKSWKMTVAKGMSPSVSFDDRWISYTAKENGHWNIYIYDRYKAKYIQVTNNSCNDFAPSFKSDNTLFFSSNRSGKLQLYSIPFAKWSQGESATKLFKEKGDYEDYAPRFSGNTTFQQGKITSFPKPSRSSFGSIFHKGYIYVAGGHQGREHTYPPESFSDRVHRYNVEKNTWEEVAPRNHKCHGFDLASHGDYIYAFGGFAYSDKYVPQWTSLDVIERYDTINNVWEIVGKMPRKRSSNVVVKVEDKVYLIGGWDSTPKFKHDYDGRFHREIDIFDLNTEQCYEAEVLAPLPLRRAFTAVSHNKKIYLIGGLSIGTLNFSFLDKVTEFDIETGSFSDAPALPFPTFAPAAGVLNDKLYVFGGMFKTGWWQHEYATGIYQYDFATKKWSNTGRFLTESKGFSQVVGDSKRLFILGGHSYLYSEKEAFLPDGIPSGKKPEQKTQEGERNNPVRTTEIFYKK